MPIPAPIPFVRLTKKQQEEQLLDLYGEPMSNSQLSASDIEKMRALVAQHDEQAEGEENNFDPSKVRKPYHFQKFPMMVYDHARSYPAHDAEQNVVRGSIAVVEVTHVKARLVSKIVHSQRELDSALSEGWNELAPEFLEEPTIEQDEEAAPVEQAHRKPGRPRREVA